MTPITITLRHIRAHHPCKEGWETLLRFLNKTKADSEELRFSTIIKSNGVPDAIWCLRALPTAYKPQIVQFAADCAEHVLHIFEERYPNDQRPRQAIEAVRNSDPDDAAARAAAYAADAAAVADAADAAAEAEEREWQAKRLIEIFG